MGHIQMVTGNTTQKKRTEAKSLADFRKIISRGTSRPTNARKVASMIFLQMSGSTDYWVPDSPQADKYLQGIGVTFQKVNVNATTNAS